MKVKPIATTLGLDRNSIYFVFELRIEHMKQESGNKLIVIENDSKQLLPYDLDKFDVVEEGANKKWVLIEHKDGSSRYTYPEFSAEDFWERFYNDDAGCISAFSSVKKQIYANLTHSDVDAIITSRDEDKLILLLITLSENNDERFLSAFISFADRMFSEDTVRNELILEFIFKYLSRFHKPLVESYFIKYYENIELGTDDLTSIVDSYFS